MSMKFCFPIAAKFLLMGVLAVLLAVATVSAGHLWRGMLAARSAQTDYLSAIALSVQMEAERRALPREMHQGNRPLGRDEVEAFKMRYRSIVPPNNLEHLPVTVSISRVKEGGGVAMTEPVLVSDAPPDPIMPKAKPEDGLSAQLRVFGGATLAVDDSSTATGTRFFGEPFWAVTVVPLAEPDGGIAGAIVVRQPMLQWRHISNASDLSVPILAEIGRAHV